MKYKKYFAGLVVCFVMLCTTSGCVHIEIPEEGEHVGYITEAGYRGLIWKTHYIKLVDARFSVGAEGYTSYWYYGVNENDLTLWKTANELKGKNEVVTIKYRCDFIVTYWERSEGCIAISIN